MPPFERDGTESLCVGSTSPSSVAPLTRGLAWAQIKLEKLQNHVDNEPCFTQMLVVNFERGVVMSIDFSGMGCAEMAFAVLKHHAHGFLPSAANIACYRAIDVSPLSKKILSCSGWKDRPLHLFHNVLDPLKLVVRSELAQLSDRVESDVAEIKGSKNVRNQAAIKVGKEMMHAAARVFLETPNIFDASMRLLCKRCRRTCCVHPPTQIYGGMTHANVCSTVCTPWSSMGHN